METSPFRKLPDVREQLARYREFMPGLDESCVQALACAWLRVTDRRQSAVPAFDAGVAIFPKVATIERRLVAADRIFGTPLFWPAMNRSVCKLLETIDGGRYLQDEWTRRVGSIRLYTSAFRYMRTETDLALERDYPGDFVVLPVFLRETGADPHAARSFPLDPFATLCLGMLGVYPGRTAIARRCEIRDEYGKEYVCGFRFPGDDVVPFAVKLEGLRIEESPRDDLCYAYGIIPDGISA